MSLLLRILQTLGTLVSRLSSIASSIEALRAEQALTRQAVQSSREEQTGKLDQILSLLVSGPAVKFIFTADLEGQITEGVTEMTMTDSQQVGLTIQPVDKKGNPAALDGAPVWATSNSEVVSITAAADGLSATAVAVGPLGTATISVKADADLGSGVTEITGTLEITVTGGGAVNVQIAAGTPTEQEPPPAAG